MRALDRRARSAPGERIGVTLRRRFPAHGAAGLAIVVVAEVLLAAGSEPVRMFFTPIVWSGAILLIDAVVFRRTGRSQLTEAPKEFAATALLSIPIWLIFEAYNLRLRNWAYIGLPESTPLRWLGWGWSFATILPALFEASDLLLAFGLGGLGSRAGRPPRGAGEALDASPGTRVAMVTLGALCLLLPLAAPPIVGSYLFGLVWVGFIFLLDPINASIGRWAPFGAPARGPRGRFAALLAGGLLCGVLWEFWNFWAGAKWIYTFPIGQSTKLFEMPALGFLGFPPFAVECFLLYDLVSAAWGGGWGRLARLPSGAASRGRYVKE
jgi:hypothetical protein